MTGGGDGIDLTGRWNGVYNYPSRLPPNSFEAEIRDSGGRVTGLVTEPGEYGEPAGIVRQSIIDGQRDGSSLSFVKIYDDLSFPTPSYRGVVLPGGDEIEGEWTIPGVWSGTFIMVRGHAGKAEEARRVTEGIDLQDLVRSAGREGGGEDRRSRRGLRP